MLTEMMDLQKSFINIENFCLHVNIYNKHGNFSKVLHDGTEYDFWAKIKKELELGNSFGIVCNGNINEDFEDKEHLSVSDVEHKLDLMFDDNFDKLHLVKINHFNQEERAKNKKAISMNSGFCSIRNMLFA
jgi:hypothetical protein